jgi:hypothetical protein
VNLEGAESGIWWLWSASDVRWRVRGVAQILDIGDRPEELDITVRRLTAAYGQPPADTEVAWVKYNGAVPDAVRAMEGPWPEGWER